MTESQNERMIEGDGYLRFLMQQANESRLPLRVTLSVGGSVVSGVLTSERQYFEGLAKALALVIARSQQAQAGEKAPASQEETVRAAKVAVERLVGGYARNRGEDPGYIHLRDVKISSPGLQSAETGGLWRGRLDAVEGFMFGSLSPHAIGGGTPE